MGGSSAGCSRTDPVAHDMMPRSVSPRSDTGHLVDMYMVPHVPGMMTAQKTHRIPIGFHVD